MKLSLGGLLGADKPQDRLGLVVSDRCWVCDIYIRFAGELASSMLPIDTGHLRISSYCNTRDHLESEIFQMQVRDTAGGCLGSEMVAARQNNRC